MQKEFDEKVCKKNFIGIGKEKQLTAVNIICIDIQLTQNQYFKKVRKKWSWFKLR